MEDELSFNWLRITSLLAEPIAVFSIIIFVSLNFLTNFASLSFKNLKLKELASNETILSTLKLDKKKSIDSPL